MGRISGICKIIWMAAWTSRLSSKVCYLMVFAAVPLALRLLVLSPKGEQIMVMKMVLRMTGLIGTLLLLLQTVPNRDCGSDCLLCMCIRQCNQSKHFTLRFVQST